jgi:hypothetical protein
MVDLVHRLLLRLYTLWVAWGGQDEEEEWCEGGLDHGRKADAEAEESGGPGASVAGSP